MRLWSRKMRHQDLTSQIVTSQIVTSNVCDFKCDSIMLVLIYYIKYEPLKNDKNIHIKGLKNDNFRYSVMSKFSTNGKWHIKISSIRKYVIKHILKHQIGIFYAVYEIKCVKNLQLNVFKCMLAFIEINIENKISAIWERFCRNNNAYVSMEKTRTHLRHKRDFSAIRETIEMIFCGENIRSLNVRM